MLEWYMLWLGVRLSDRQKPVFYQDGWTYHHSINTQDSAETPVFWY